MKIIKTFDIEVHFEFSESQITSIEKVRKETGIPVYAIEDTGAIIIDNGKIIPIGNVHYYG